MILTKRRPRYPGGQTMADWLPVLAGRRRPSRSTPLEVRFWALVNLDGPVHPTLGTACWLWTGHERKGYGFICERRQKRSAHRYGWELRNGPVPAGLFVLHRCDTPLCVNPAHLFVGTQRENLDDCVRKGRWRVPRGEGHPHARLTEELVREIRRRYRPRHPADGITAMAEEFGVAVPTVSQAARGVHWAHVGAERVPPCPPEPCGAG